MAAASAKWAQWDALTGSEYRGTLGMHNCSTRAAPEMPGKSQKSRARKAKAFQESSVLQPTWCGTGFGANGKANGGHANGNHTNGSHNNDTHANGGHANGGHANSGYANGSHAEGSHANGSDANGGYTNGGNRGKRMWAWPLPPPQGQWATPWEVQGGIPGQKWRQVVASPPSAPSHVSPQALGLLSPGLVVQGFVAPAAQPLGERGRKLLLQVCWDFHSPGGCTRLSCKWKHCPLDRWQTAWLELQRFCFGAQLGTFETLGGLAEAVHTAFADRARLANETPPSTAVALEAALGALGSLGYPFHRSVTPLGEQPGIGGRPGRFALLAALRVLVSQRLLPGTKVLPVGSFAWGVDTLGSDLDVVLVAPGGGEVEPEALYLLADIFVSSAAASAPDSAWAPPPVPQLLQSATAVLRGRGSGYPVLTIRAVVDGEPLSADVCCAGQLGSIRDAVLFRHMIAQAPELATGLRLLKRWLRARAIPTSCEGGYPQVFWMRLAARTFQQARSARASGNTSCGGDVAGSIQVAHEAIQASAHGASEEEAQWGRSLGGCDTGRAESEELICRRLRSFCKSWSVSLPAWGDVLNLTGEDPVPALKRLAMGVYGATTLLCLMELRYMAKEGEPEMQPLSTHQHMCPAAPGFWAAFLIPTRSEAEGAARPAGNDAEVVAAYVWKCSGPLESVRQCVCNLCCEPRASSVAPAGAEVAKLGEDGGQAFLSRRETDWLLWARISRRAASARALGHGGDAGRGVSGADGRWEQPMGLSPPHFVTLLPGDPASSLVAATALRRLQDLLAEPEIAASLPAPYPLYRFSRRAMMESRRTLAGEAE
mmetsp:Transcript_75954/g.217519  ORF Transcript_75954/g.217519 Transcript_75954/m.217519 type:complete len:827 (-) Transcript_75954:88-2568(-)